MKTLFFFVLFAMTVFNTSHAQSISKPWIKLPMPMMKMTGAYMVISNDSDKAMNLTAIEGEDCEAYEIHTHEKVDGVMKMRQLQKLEIPAHGSVTLKPKSYHVMMIQLNKKLTEGEKRKMTLIFDNGKKIEIEAPVKKP